MRLVSVVHEDALVLLGSGPDLAEQIVDLPRDGPHLDDGVHQAGRANDLLDDDALRLLELVLAGRRRDVDGLRARASSNSSNLSGRLSSALGRRKPYSTSVSLRARSPRYIAWTCGTVWCDSSRMHQEVLGEVVDERGRRLARPCGPRGGASSSRCRCRSPSAPSSRGRTACAARAAASRGSAPPCRRSRAARGALRGCSRWRAASAPAA